MFGKYLNIALSLPLLSIAFSATAGTVVAPALERQASAAFLELEGLSHEALSPNDLLVEVLKQTDSGSHVMGSVTQVLAPDVHGTPPTRFFFAHRVAGRWEVGLSGTDAFVSELMAMPGDLVDEDERHAFVLSQSATPPSLAGEFLGLGLPWAEGSSWSMTGGPHGDDGRTPPFNSIDFWSSNGGVRAPAAGRIYTTCARFGSALRTIVHDNGWSTSYYHMERLPNLADGSVIAKGTVLGTVGNGLPCGGQTSGAHVHFSLMKGAQKVAVNNKVLGGWTFFQGQASYQGKAVRGSTTQLPGQSTLRNFGDNDQGL